MGIVHWHFRNVTNKAQPHETKRTNEVPIQLNRRRVRENIGKRDGVVATPTVNLQQVDRTCTSAASALRYATRNPTQPIQAFAVDNTVGVGKGTLGLAVCTMKCKLKSVESVLSVYVSRTKVAVARTTSSGSKNKNKQQ